MNSDIPLVSVGLENADVTLYPVLQETQILTADKYAVIVNSESDVATITANQEVNWSYTIVGADDALVTTAPDIATVVAGSVNGSVKLSATLVSDPTVTAEIEILVIGSSNWRPGLNLFTRVRRMLLISEPLRKMMKHFTLFLAKKGISIFMTTQQRRTALTIRTKQ